MSSLVLSQSGTGNKNMKARITYGASAGTIDITKIEFCRNDEYLTQEYAVSDGKIVVVIGTKTIKVPVTAVYFKANNVYTTAVDDKDNVTNNNCSGNTAIKISFENFNVENIKNSKFEATINAGYKTPSMTLSSTDKGLNFVDLKCTYTNSTPEKIQVYEEKSQNILYEGTDFTPKIENLSFNTQYKFKVRGYANGTWGGYSNVVTVITSKGATLNESVYSMTNASPSITFNLSNDLSGSSVAYSLQDEKNIVVLYEDIATTRETITLTDNEINQLLQGNPASKLSNLKLRLYTNGIVTSEKDVVMNFVNCNPIISEPYYKDIGPFTPNITGDFFKIIEKYSEIQLIIYSMESKNYATEGSYNVLIDNVNVASIQGTGKATYTINIGNIESEESKVQVEAIDSRGFSSKVDVPLELYSYDNPTIAKTKVTRENMVEESTSIAAEGTYRYYPTFENSNSITSIKYRYRINEETISWSDYKSITNFTCSEGKWYVTDFGIDGDTALGFDINNSYIIELLIEDEITTKSIFVVLNSSNPTLWIDRKNKRLGIGKKPNETLDVKGNVKISGNYYLSSGNTILDYEVVEEW